MEGMDYDITANNFTNVEPEIATPPLFGTILPGVTRSSLLDLASKWVGV